MQRIVYLLIGTAALLMGLALHARNHTLVSLDFYTGAFELPLSLLIILSLFAGVALGILAMMPTRWRLGRRVLRLEREIRLQSRTEASPGTNPDSPNGA